MPETVDPGTPEEELPVVFHWAFESGREQSNSKDRLVKVRCIVRIKAVMRDVDSELAFWGRPRHIHTSTRKHIHGPYHEERHLLGVIEGLSASRLSRTQTSNETGCYGSGRQG